MVTVTAAKSIIQNNVEALMALLLPLKEAAGKILAEDIFATTDIPAFRQSSMDGYAFAFDEIDSVLTVEGEMAAGSPSRNPIGKGRAIRIFTGAAVPAGADTVVMQEKTRIENGQLVIEDESIQRSANVRPVGSEISAGQLAIKKNSLLTPAAIGFLAGIGVANVPVFPNPRISLILTGNELQDPGLPLMHGQIYESNSYSLTAALQSIGLSVHETYRADDNLQQLISILNEALAVSDLVILTGGVSVGDYDFVVEASKACGINQLFHKVKQRPGKPLFFGKKEQKLIFGLPGNPSSVLSCFYEYVTEALALQTKRALQLKAIQCKLAMDCRKAPGLVHFQKAWYDGEKVTPLTGQESYKLNSFASANCLLMLDSEKEEYSINELVTIHLLPV